MGETKGMRIASSHRSLRAVEAWKALLLVIGLAAATVVGGCAGIVSATNPNNPGAATIALNPTTVSFGTVGVGKLSSQTMTIANTGTASVNVTQATVSNSQFKVSGMALPMAMGAGQSGTFTVSVTPTAIGTVTGTLTVQGDAGSTPSVVNLSANAVNSAPQISLSSSAVSFGSVQVSTSGSSSVTISNTGTADLNVSGVTISGAGFAFSGITTPKLISAGQSSAIALMFVPPAQGAATGTLTISSNDSAHPTMSVALSGTGTVAPTGNLQANQSSLAFGSVTDGSNLVKQVVLTNTGGAAVQISAVSVSGTGFTVSGITTPATLNPSATTTLSVKFAPTTTGAVTGSVTITSNTPGSPMTIPVSGVGVQPAISISPANFNFGSVVNGQTSLHSFAVTNTGTASLTISTLSISATGYTVNGLTVPSTVAPGASVTFNAVFAPATVGSLSGTVNIVSNAPNSPLTVALSGTGVAATKTLSLSSTTLAFGNVSTTSPSTLSETITNTGNSAVQISAITVSGTGYSLSGASAVTLNPTQTFTFSVIFNPTAAGVSNGNISITSNATGSPAAINLTGTGVQVTTHTVGLTWTESGSSITGFNVYRSTTSGSGYVKINSGGLVPSMNYSDTSVQNSTTYFYVTTAVDGSGNESTFSNEASAVVPN